MRNNTHTEYIYNNVKYINLIRAILSSYLYHPMLADHYPAKSLLKLKLGIFTTPFHLRLATAFNKEIEKGGNFVILLAKIEDRILNIEKQYAEEYLNILTANPLAPSMISELQDFLEKEILKEQIEEIV